MTPKFKETEIGLIPEDWEIKDVEEVCKLYRESFQPTDDDIRPYIGLEHIKENSLTLNGIGTSKDVKSSKLVFNEGQILFGKLRPYFRKVYRPDFNGVCSTDIFVIESKKGYNNGFLFYFFADPMMIEEATRSSEGTRMPRASWKYLTELKRPFPPIEEQKLIANFLSSIDQKIELNQRMNQTLEEIGRAIFKHWFVDFEFPDEQGKPYKSSGGEMVDSELGEIPKGWNVMSLGDICDVKGGKRLPKGHDLVGYKTSHPYIRVTNLNDNNINFANLLYLKEETFKKISNYTITKDDLYISIVGTVGLVGLIPNKLHGANLTENCAKITNLKGITKELLYFFLNSQYGQEQVKTLTVGSTQGKLALSRIKTIKIAIPYDDELISKIGSFLTSVWKLKDHNLEQIENLSQIRDSLLPKLMSGKIRLD